MVWCSFASHSTASDLSSFVEIYSVSPHFGKPHVQATPSVRSCPILPPLPFIKNLIK